MLTTSELKDHLLDELSILFARSGTKLGSFNLPSKSSPSTFTLANTMIDDELTDNRPDLIIESANLRKKLNPDQQNAFEAIVSRVQSKLPCFFFVSGYGGTGKMFLWNAIVTYLRSTGAIVLTVASFGVASLLLPKCKTAHSRFKIPADIDESSVCDIKRGTMLADLIKSASLVI